MQRVMWEGSGDITGASCLSVHPQRWQLCMVAGDSLQRAVLALQSRESLHWELWWDWNGWSRWVPPSVTKVCQSSGSVGDRAFGLEPPSARRAQQEQGDPAVTKTISPYAHGGSGCSAKSCWDHGRVCSWGRAPDEPSLVIPRPSAFLASGDTSSLLSAVTKSSSVLLLLQGQCHSAWNPSWMLPLLSWTGGWLNLLVWGDWFRFYCATEAEQKVFKIKCAHRFLPYSPVFTLISRSTMWCPDGFVSS